VHHALLELTGFDEFEIQRGDLGIHGTESFGKGFLFSERRTLDRNSPKDSEIDVRDTCLNRILPNELLMF
jgi:hypothetical protein